MSYDGGRGGGGCWYGAGRGGGDGRCGGAGPSVGGGWGRGAADPFAAGSAGYNCDFAGETLQNALSKRAPPSSVILPEAIRAAEAAAGEVVLRLHPTVEAEERRHEVIEYIKKLVGSSLGCEVFSFGSVPLKTYLPDGDVDVTIMSNSSLEGTFITDVRNLLREQNIDANFRLRKLQFINAEVKLFKCVIGNITVDISFNQIGGVSALCFLEMVDREIGQNHLFKRSIMLIKAWCYHESCILGGHHGLISTYALEILILHIFNKFHKSLHGPLEALYMFLEYYSRFEWDKYCITLNGPVALSALPYLSVEAEAINDEFVLSKDPLKGSLDRFLVAEDGSEGWDAKFRPRIINIVDPLKRSNNLGRSVSIENFQRIQTAFSFGAQKLGQILMLPPELIADEIYGFYENTLMSHGRGERLDLGASIMSQSFLDPDNALRYASGLKISYSDEDENGSPNDSLEQSDKESHVKASIHKISGAYFPGYAIDRPWNKIWSSKSSVDFYKVSGAIMSVKSSFIRNHSSLSEENGNIKQCGQDCAPEELQQQNILTSSTRTNALDVSSFCPVKESNWTYVPQEKTCLPPFTPSSLLDHSGDLNLHLGCLRNVQYHLEFLFDELLLAVQEASLAGILDEDSFRIPFSRFSSNNDAGPTRPYLAASTDVETRNLSPFYHSDSTGYVLQQNMPLHSELDYISNGMQLYAPDFDIYDVSSFYTTEDIPLMNETLIPEMDMSLLFDSDNYPVYWPYSNGGTTKTVGTGTYIPKTTFEHYRERMSYDKGRKQKQRQPNRVYSSNEHIVGSPTSKSLVSKAGSVSLEDQASIHCGTKQIATSEPSKVENSQQRYCSNKKMIDNQNFGTNDELVRPENDSRETAALPHHGGNGQENRPVSHNGRSSPAASKDYDQIKAQQEENLVFGNFGFELNSSQFSREFPPLPASERPTNARLSFPPSKRPVEASPHLSASERSLEAIAPLPPSRRPVEATAAQIRPEGLYQLRNDDDFPPLQAGTR